MNSYGGVQRGAELKRYGMARPRLAWNRSAIAETGYDENRLAKERHRKSYG